MLRATEHTTYKARNTQTCIHGRELKHLVICPYIRAHIQANKQYAARCEWNNASERHNRIHKKHIHILYAQGRFLIFPVKGYLSDWNVYFIHKEIIIFRVQFVYKLLSFVHLFNGINHKAESQTEFRIQQKWIS